jgi:hypothetical protein
MSVEAPPPYPSPPYLTRVQVSRLVRENLTQRALRFNLVLDDVSITHVAFSPEFTHAVEAKQVGFIVCYPTQRLTFLGCPTNCTPCCFPSRSSYSGEAGMPRSTRPRVRYTTNASRSLSSFAPRVKPGRQNSLENLYAGTKASLNFAGLRQQEKSQRS